MRHAKAIKFPSKVSKSKFFSTIKISLFISSLAFSAGVVQRAEGPVKVTRMLTTKAPKSTKGPKSAKATNPGA